MAGVDKHEPGLGLPSEEIGYFPVPTNFGAGSDPEAVEAILLHGFTALGYAAFWAAYYDGNVKSRRVMEKCGMTYRFSRREEVVQLGEVRQAHYYAITREEWMQ